MGNAIACRLRGHQPSTPTSRVVASLIASPSWGDRQNRGADPPHTQVWIVYPRPKLLSNPVNHSGLGSTLTDFGSFGDRLSPFSEFFIAVSVSVDAA